MGKVIGFHIIMTYYGFWLPNDPRGSGSKVIRAEHLKPFGPATFVTSSRSVARRPHDFRIRRLAKSALKYPPVILNGQQAQSVAIGFCKHFEKHRIPCYSFASLPEHVHAVTGQVPDDIHEVLIDLKAAAVHQLIKDGIHPLKRFKDENGKFPKMWATGGRHIYLFDDEDMFRSINYVRDNPVKAGLPAQHWTFVRRYTSIQR